MRWAARRTRLSFARPMFQRSNLTRLTHRVSPARTYSTRPNQAIIDLLQRCASCVGWRRNRVCLLIVLQVSKRRTQAQHAMHTKCALFRSQWRPFTNTTSPSARGRRPSRYAFVSPLPSTSVVTLPFQLRGIGVGIANRIDFFLQGKDYVCRSV